MNIMLEQLTIGADGIYGYDFSSESQKNEIEFREKVNSNIVKGDLLDALSKHHSIPVMDREVELFLNDIPLNGVVIDAGGCWGWHWRGLDIIRPDVTIYIVDFVRSNLYYAKKMLKHLIGKNIYLIHGDITALKLPDNSFDGYWSVQVLQHVPHYQDAVDEAFRILKHNAVFSNYSFNNQIAIKWIYKLFGKNYHETGVVNVEGGFHLDRASKKQLFFVESRFNSRVRIRFSEVLFSPELGISFMGKTRSLLGIVDSFLSNNKGLFSSIARQQSYHVRANKFRK